MRRLLLLCGLVLFEISTLAWAETPDGYTFRSFDDGLQQARQQEKKLFVYFGRHGCGWCAKTNREVFSDKDIRTLYSAHYVLVYVDTESGQPLTLPSGERITEMEFAARQRVIATPMFAFYEPDGKYIFKISGLQSIADFKAYDRYVHDGHYRRQGLRDFLATPP